MKDLVQELGYYFKAPYPFLYLVSWEEARVEQLVRSAAGQAGLQVQVHTPPCTPNATGFISQLGTGDPEVVLLKDFHPLLARPEIVRALRDIATRAANIGSTLVFLSPMLRLPEELERDMIVLDIPLPGPKELEEVLDQVLVQHEVLFDDAFRADLVRAARGLTAQEAHRAFCKSLLKGGSERLRDASLVVEEKRQILRRTQLLEFWDRPPALEEVGGLDQLKRWLGERREAFGPRARAFGLPEPKGLLILGVQGCGKSLSAKAVASLWRVPLARFDFGDLFRHSTTPEENLRHLIKLAESMAPLVLWLDEIDKAFSAISAATETLSRVFATFITWLQEKTSPVFVIATANSVQYLPPELLRKGRFDEIFFVDLPNIHERQAIFSIHLASRGRSPDTFALVELARTTENFSGAEIEQVVVDGLYRAFYEDRELQQGDLLAAVQETVPLFFTQEEVIKQLREWAQERARHASSDTSLADLFEDKSPE